MPEDLNKQFKKENLPQEEILAMERKVRSVAFKEQTASDRFRQELKGKILAGNKKVSRAGFFQVKVWAPALAFVFVAVFASTLFYQPQPKLNEEIFNLPQIDQIMNTDENAGESRSLKTAAPTTAGSASEETRADSFASDYPAGSESSAKSAPASVSAPTAETLSAGMGYNLPPGANNDLSLLFFGDIMLDRHVAEKIKTASGSLDFIFSSLETSGIFQNHDIISANLEGAVIDNGAHYPPELSNDFAFGPAIVSQLAGFGFNYFNIANNHLADQGKNGIIETEKNLTALGFDFSGCIDREISGCTSRIIEKKGRKIGMIGASMVYGKLDENKLLAEVKKIASSTGLAVVQMHWGAEYQHESAANQIALAHKLIDAGADIVAGHHPHVVGGMEIYQGKPIFYSLGNFVFDQYFSVDTQEELGVEIITNGNGFNINLLPIKSAAARLRLMNEKERKEFLTKLSGWSIGGDDFKKQIKGGTVIINK